MIIEVNTGFPLEWGREYYTIASEKKQKRAPCSCCDETGKVTIKGVEYKCPACNGDWRNKEVIGETKVYSVAKWVLERVNARQNGIVLQFRRTNEKGAYASGMEVWSWGFKTMVSSNNEKLYDDYKEAMREVKRLNAAEKEAAADG